MVCQNLNRILAYNQKPNLQETEAMDVGVKSRDIDLSFSSPTKRKSKKKPEASPSSSSSSGNVTTPTQTASTSHLMTVKIVTGVALISVIIGIILGRKY